MPSTFTRILLSLTCATALSLSLVACASDDPSDEAAAVSSSVSASPTSSPMPEPTWERTPCDATSADGLGEFYGAPVIVDESERGGGDPEVVPGKYLIGVELEDAEAAPDDLITRNALTAAYNGDDCEAVDVLSVTSLGVNDVNLDGVWLVEVDSDVKLGLENGGMVFTLHTDLVDSGEIGIGAIFRSEHLYDLNGHYRQP